LLPFFQAAELSPFADSRLLSYWNLPYCVPQYFNETLYGQFPIFCLAAALLRYDSQNAVFADAICKPAHDEFFVF